MNIRKLLKNFVILYNISINNSIKSYKQSFIIKPIKNVLNLWLLLRWW